MSFFVKDSGSPRWGIITAAVIVFVVLLSAIGTACSVAGGYKDEAVRVISVENVKEQKTALIQLYNEAQTSADNACNAANINSNDDSPTFVEDPALAYKATYRRIANDYNRRQDNLFEARKVGPQGYPKRLPDVRNQDDFCDVAETLQDLYQP